MREKHSGIRIPEKLRRKRIVINADDYGLTRGCDQAIEECMAAGAITSASCLVWDRQPEISPMMMQGRIGLHLRLTDGRPSSPLRSVPSLISRDGNFPRSRPGVLTRAMESSEVRGEWLQQGFLFNGTPTHLDSHHHVHSIPGIGRIYADQCMEFGCAAVPLSMAQRDELRSLHVPCADFTEIRWTDGNLATLQRLLIEDFAQYDTVHLMTHPGFVDDELRLVSSMVDVRRFEYWTLLDEEFAGWLDGEGIQKIGMAEL